MNRLLMTTKEALREHTERLERAERARQVSEVYRRMRIRGRLRKAILETVRLDGSAQELAVELHGLVRSAERRLSGRPCC